jgi:hypothetical protein
MIAEGVPVDTIAAGTDRVQLDCAAMLEAARLAPRDLGISRIGRFGCFKPQFEATLWRRHLLPALRLSRRA